LLWKERPKEEIVTPEQMRAREAMSYTRNRYATAADRGRVGEMAECFTEDGVLELADGVHAGRAAISAAFGSRKERSTDPRPDAPRMFLRHHLTTSDVEFGDDGVARGRTYFLVMTPAGLDHCGHYLDEYVAVGERWLLRRRRIRLDWVLAQGWLATGNAR
jgi:hypothetical protein